MSDTITVPDYITDENGMVAYIRQELIKRGIDPNSVHPVDAGDTLVLTAPRKEPFMVEMSFTYDRTSPFYDEAWEKNKHLWYRDLHKPRVKPASMAYQQGFHSSGG